MTTKHTAKYAAVALIAAALAVTPLAPAEAHGWHHGGGGGLALGLFAGVAAVTGAAVAIAAAPFNAVAEVASAPPPPVQPVYYQAPVQTYYAPAYAYAYPPQRVVYSYPAYGYARYGYR